MLLLHLPDDPHARYSSYAGEILRLEGFADVDEAPLDTLDGTALAAHDLVVLPRCTTTIAQAELLLEYVRGGGRLLAFHPDRRLGGELGASPVFDAAVGARLRVEPGPATAGLWGGPIQIPVPVPSWQAGDRASVLAWAAPGPEGRVIPGVIHGRLGRGEAVLVTFDLPHAVARLRQGDPELADICSYSVDGIYRGADLLGRQLDPELKDVPQADVLTALLGRLIEILAPRPRIWYYPTAAERSVLVMTSDDDWSSLQQFEAILAELRRRDGTCTFYMVPGSRIPAETAWGWERDGHTFSVHPALDTDHGRVVGPPELQQLVTEPMVRANVERHQREFGREVRTIRNHCIRWSGYADLPKAEAELGVAMDCNYVTSHRLTLGYMCGSGRALRFVDADGTVIDCFQLPGLWTEEVILPNRNFGHSAGWSLERGVAETTTLLREAASTFATPVTINSHPVSFATYSAPLIEANWDAAREQGMRIVSADRWLDWTLTRESLRLHRDGDGWTLRAPVGVAEATVLLPGEGSHVLWGRRYEAVTVQDLAPGEERALTRNSER